MKRVIMVAALTLIIGVAPAQAATTIGVFGDGKSLTTTMYSTIPVIGNVGIFGWSLTKTNYAETLVGLNYRFAPWGNIEVGLGLEQDPNPLRGTASLWLGTGSLSLLSTFENGGSGWWNRTVTSWQTSKWLSLGAEYRRFVGLGPRIEVTIPEASTSLWITIPLYDPEKVVQETKVLSGIMFSF